MPGTSMRNSLELDKKYIESESVMNHYGNTVIFYRLCYLVYRK